MDINKFTNIGGRSNNEDYCDYYIESDKACIVVCDGLGGHDCGEVASKAVVEHIILNFKSKPIISEDNMVTLLQGAQDFVVSLQNEDRDLVEMKTTVTCVLIHNNTMVTGHVGDSRIYLFRKNKTLFESEDHSVPYALFKAKRIKKKDIRTHEDSNVVLRSIGSIWDRPKYEIHTFNKVKSGDGLLLCTDGFWENIIEKDMTKTLKKSSRSAEWMNEMVQVVQSNILHENHDNYTAIALICD